MAVVGRLAGRIGSGSAGGSAGGRGRRARVSDAATRNTDTAGGSGQGQELDYARRQSAWRSSVVDDGQ